jgi:quercetin dioxygenase-like cupin family protein/uncharacterized membrane protein
LHPTPSIEEQIMSVPTQITKRRGFVASALGALATLVTRRAGASPSDAASPRVVAGRRIITGVDAQGRSRIESVAPPPPSAAWKEPEAQGMDFWVTRQVPTRVDTTLEPSADYESNNRAVPGGVVGRLMTWQPGLEYPMHTTPTLDLGVIVSGKLELILETGSMILGPGDVIVQRGTAHSWRVVGKEPCTWVVVLIDALPRG